MGEYILWVVGAFVLYIVVLPLLGALLGFMAITLLPYLAGAGLVLIAVKIMGITGAPLWAWLLAGLWAITVFAMRRRLITSGTELGWHEGHYKAACATLRFKRSFV